MATIPRKRRSARFSERLTPCEACGYILSQRHHLLPAARHGENEHTAQLCATCHEAYHAMERGWIDIRAGRRNTHAMRIYRILWDFYGGRENRAFDRLCKLVELSETLQRQNAAQSDIFELFLVLFDPQENIMQDMKVDDIRRGDTVRLANGHIVRVVSTTGGYIFTTEGTYGPWQVVKVAKS